MKNKVAIVSSNYYENITEGLVTGAKDKLDPSFDVYDYVVDGAWELIYKINQLSSNDNIDKLHTMAESLLTYETIDADQIDDIMAGAKPRAPKDWDEPKTPKNKTSKKTSIKGPAEEL